MRVHCGTPTVAAAAAVAANVAAAAAKVMATAMTTGWGEMKKRTTTCTHLPPLALHRSSGRAIMLTAVPALSAAVALSEQRHHQQHLPPFAAGRPAAAAGHRPVILVDLVGRDVASRRGSSIRPLLITVMVITTRWRCESQNRRLHDCQLPRLNTKTKMPPSQLTPPDLHHHHQHHHH